MINAKWMHATTRTSSVSNRETMRRNPLSRRHSRSISVRGVDRARAYSPGVSRVCWGGTTGTDPHSPARSRVASPSYARSINRWTGRGLRPTRCRRVRPSGASWAWPGARAHVRAVRAAAATRCIVVVPPPRARPMAGGPCVLTPPCHRDGPGRGYGPRRRLRASRGGSACGATGQRRDPAPRAWPNDSCAYRGWASGRIAWGARAMCPPARPRTRGHGVRADCRASRGRVGSAHTARLGDTVRR